MTTIEEKIILRLQKEVKELQGLLKMRIRVEGAKSQGFKELIKRTDRLVELEEQASSQITYIKEIEAENSHLRKTCDKFSELSNSVQLLHEHYRQEIKAITEEKLQLAHTHNQLSISIETLSSQVVALNSEIDSLKAENKHQQDQWDRDRAIFAQEKIAKKTQEQKLISTLDKLERAKISKAHDEKVLMEECLNLKRCLEDMHQKINKNEEFEDILREKDEKIEALVRKCKLLERELKLIKDEEDL